MNGLSRDEINRIIYDNGLFHGTMALGVVMDADHLERFAALVAAAEREACAKVCEIGTGEPVQMKTLEILRQERERIAAAIRARREQ